MSSEEMSNGALTQEERAEAMEMFKNIMIANNNSDNVSKLEFIEFAEMVSTKMRIMHEELMELGKMKMTTIQTTGLPFDVSINSTDSELGDALSDITQFYKDMDSIYTDYKVKEDAAEKGKDPSIA